MPIDTSIYNLVGQGVTPIKSPMELEAQALQMRHLAAQSSLLGIEAQNAKQTAADQKQLRDVASSATSPEDLEQKILAVGTPAAIKMHHELTTARLTTEKARKESELTDTLIQKNQNDAAAGVTGSLMALPPEQRAAAWPDALTKLAEINPDKAKVVADKYPQYPGDDVLNQMHSFTQTESQRLQQQTEMSLRAHQAATLTETTRHNKASEEIDRIRANKPSASVVLQTMGQLPQDFDPSKPLNPALEGQAHAVGRWDGKPQQPTTRTPYATQVNARADWLAKNVYGHPEGLPGESDVAEVQRGKIDYGPSGNNGKILQSIDVASQHVARLQELGDALKNGNQQNINDAMNYFKQRFGDKAVTNYNTLAAFVVPEILKVAKGAGMINEKEEERLQKLASNHNSPDQIQGFIDEVTRIMGARAVALEPGFNRYFGGHSITERLTPESVAAFRRVGINVGGQAGQPGPSGAPSGQPAVAPGAPAGAAPSYKGVVMPKVKFDGLSAAAKKAFTDGGGTFK